MIYYLIVCKTESVLWVCMILFFMVKKVPDYKKIETF